jgi:hypothetical protein
MTAFPPTAINDLTIVGGVERRCNLNERSVMTGYHPLLRPVKGNFEKALSAICGLSKAVDFSNN